MLTDYNTTLEPPYRDNGVGSIETVNKHPGDSSPVYSPYIWSLCTVPSSIHSYSLLFISITYLDDDERDTFFRDTLFNSYQRQCFYRNVLCISMLATETTETTWWWIVCTTTDTSSHSVPCDNHELPGAIHDR